MDLSINIERLISVLTAKQGRLEQMLSEINWPLPGHIGAAMLDDVADSYLAGVLNRADVEAIFVEFYRRHGMDDLGREWALDDILQLRRRMLRDSLWAHNNERYTLSVPVMLAQLEGIITEVCRHRGRLIYSDLKQYVSRITADGTRFQRHTARFMTITLWNNFKHGDPLPDLSRHAILHGADLTYGTAANSLRTILSFDSIKTGLQAMGKLSE